MWLLYLAALILGVGVLAVQLLAGTDHDLSGDVGLDASHPDVGPGILSVRSAMFGLAAFGIVGTPLQAFHLLYPPVTLAVALAAAIAATMASGFVFRALEHGSVSGAASIEDVLGREARVLVECRREGRGKVRVALGGQVVDLVAITDEPRLEAGTGVEVVEVRDDVVRVATPKRRLPGPTPGAREEGP
jgi:membrane protein implicated in regulation of membrane protease activity